MMDHTQNNLSDKFFQKCPQLTIIEEGFDISEIKKQLNIRDTQCQFQLLRALTQTKKHKLQFRVNSVVQNKKNRYPEQSIYQHSRVILKNDIYINANYVEKTAQNTVILTQGPTATTVIDFQNMIRQQGVSCVLMLCNLIEGGKTRCYDYLTEKEEIQNIDNAIEISSVSIRSQNEPTYVYKHVFYSQWPDKGLPISNKHIKRVIKEVSAHSKIIIHCSAGLGRSGVIAAILHAVRHPNVVSVFGTVRNIREKRFGAIQNHQQYRYVYKYLAEQ